MTEKEQLNRLADPWAVSKATKADFDAVKAALPFIVNALEELKIFTPRTLVAAIATAAVECGFKPVEEAYYLSEKARMAYFDKSKYGRLDPVTKKRYFGRGLIQLTWKYNYESYGAALGIDLVNNPEKALDVKVASRIMAKYFVNTRIPAAAEKKNWVLVRKKVNGGTNGLDVFLAHVDALSELIGE